MSRISFGAHLSKLISGQLEGAHIPCQMKKMDLPLLRMGKVESEITKAIFSAYIMYAEHFSKMATYIYQEHREIIKKGEGFPVLSRFATYSVKYHTLKDLFWLYVVGELPEMLCYPIMYRIDSDWSIYVSEKRVFREIPVSQDSLLLRVLPEVQRILLLKDTPSTDQWFDRVDVKGEVLGQIQSHKIRQIVTLGADLKDKAVQDKPAFDSIEEMKHWLSQMTLERHNRYFSMRKLYEDRSAFISSLVGALTGDEIPEVLNPTNIDLAIDSESWRVVCQERIDVEKLNTPAGFLYAYSRYV